MKHALVYLLMLPGVAASGQQNGTWISYQNKGNIVAIEETHDKRETYYLTKTGRIIGRDSLYLFDNEPDCESEGFIRFSAKKTGKTGMFNRNGDIVIPAEYDNLSKVRNGLIIGLKGAKKEYLDSSGHSGCDHYTWIGGEVLLIDTNNAVLAENFSYDNNLNFFSLVVSAQPHPDPLRQSFKTVNGQYYSFIDFGKEFSAWLKTSLLDDLTKENLLKATYPEVRFWKEPGGWITESKESFIARNFELIKSKLLELNSASCAYNIFQDRLNRYIYQPEGFKAYFNNCGTSEENVYPVKSIVITYKNDDDITQDHFNFLRTAQGYKLISTTVKKEEGVR